jgi:hypothetical protein
MTIRRFLETETRHEIDTCQRLDMMSIEPSSVSLLDCCLGCVISGCAQRGGRKDSIADDVLQVESHVMQST